MTEEHLVSIVIPVYNAGGYLKETLESVFKQTWKNIEIIAVDDGSTDDSLSVLRTFTSPLLKVISQQRRGASAARNLGMRHTRGQYIQFLDADDLLSENKIAVQMAAIDGQTDKLAVCSTIHFDHGQKPGAASGYEEEFLYSTADPVDFLIRLWGGYDSRGSMVQPNAWLVPLELIKKAGQWDEEISVDDDGEFFCRVILHSAGIIKTTGAYNYYRKHPAKSSLSAGRTREHLRSLLRSAMSKKRNLLLCRDNPPARHAIYRQFYEIFIYSYPSFPEIYKKTILELPENSNPTSVNLGGKAINWVARFLGVKTALYARHLWQKVCL